ncbi:hypothetical protein BGZ96_008111 [Linnemannia gamsii]|uniref:Uncharacterized protein n=1 Tax=Linnemannia gamsii TaxID=64522 RepID=A0ABQ7JZ81_9FUNG|nr:hypothetical protein BGZ96_008111 [Linnemannia gamsii]
MDSENRVVAPVPQVPEKANSSLKGGGGASVRSEASGFEWRDPDDDDDGRNGL